MIQEGITKAFRVGEWLVLPDRNRIERDGEAVALQRLTMLVLLYLAARPGTVVSYDELLEALWPGRYAGEDAVHRRVAALRRAFGDDAKAPRFVETIPKRGYRLIAPVEQPYANPAKPAGQHTLTAGAALAGLAAAALIALLWTGAVERPVPTGAPPAEELPLPIELISSPPSANVSIRPYGESEPWQPLGVTPLRDELHRGTWLLRLMADGRETVELAIPNPGVEFNNTGGAPFVIALPERGSVPEGMVYVPPINAMIPLTGFARIEDLGPFYIGRTEVSNAEFAAFVDAGGYEDSRYWNDLLESDDALPFQRVATRFTDSTGQPGPAGWIDGHHPEGEADLPVTGVSWYEAMAYARFRGATLPSARHWARAALGIAEWSEPLAPALAAAAHLEGAAPRPVYGGGAVSTFGALNLVGNVREWTRSHTGAHKLALGSSFATPAWTLSLPSAADPLLRLPHQGFRLARYDEAKFELRPMQLDSAVPELPSVSDEEYARILSLLRYEFGTIGTRDVALESHRPEGDWIRRKVLIPTSDPADPLPVLIFAPAEGASPRQAVVFLSPGSSHSESSFPSNELDITRYHIDFVVRTGRALIWPILWGTHERFVAPDGDSVEARRAHRQQGILRQRDEIGRVMDYLEDSSEFDGGRVALLAVSYGANVVAPPILAAEPRIRTAVLMAASLLFADPDETPLLLNSNTFWPRIDIPILIGRGRYDFTSRVIPSMPALADALGTPDSAKKSILYEASHWPFPQALMKRDTLAWLDAQLGPAK